MVEPSEGLSGSDRGMPPAAEPGGGRWSAAEAKAMLDELTEVAPPAVMRRALGQALEGMTPEQRVELFLLTTRGQPGAAPAAEAGLRDAEPSPYREATGSRFDKVLAAAVAAFTIKQILKRAGR